MAGIILLLGMVFFTTFVVLSDLKLRAGKKRLIFGVGGWLPQLSPIPASHGMVLHAENKTTNYAMDLHGGLMNLLASEFSTP